MEPAGLRQREKGSAFRLFDRSRTDRPAWQLPGSGVLRGDWPDQPALDILNIDAPTVIFSRPPNTIRRPSGEKVRLVPLDEGSGR